MTPVDLDRLAAEVTEMRQDLVHALALNVSLMARNPAEVEALRARYMQGAVDKWPAIAELVAEYAAREPCS